jgi:acyl carrier protein
MSDELKTNDLLDEIQAMYRRRGINVALRPDTEVEEIGFRSLDFSELALRVEQRLGAELNFEASPLRRIETVQDVIDFLKAAAEAA